MSKVRLNVAVSSDIDRALRMYLASTGGRRGDISKAFELAMEQFLERNQSKMIIAAEMAAIKEKSGTYSADEIEDSVSEAIDWARSEAGRTAD